MKILLWFKAFINWLLGRSPPELMQLGGTYSTVNSVLYRLHYTQIKHNPRNNKRTKRK